MLKPIRNVALVMLLIWAGQAAAVTAEQSLAHVKHFAESCKRKQWTACNLARYDIIKKGGFKLRSDGEGTQNLVGTSSQASKLYFETLHRMNNPASTDHGDFVGDVAMPGTNDFASMFMDIDIREPIWGDLVPIAEHFRRAGVRYDVDRGFDSERLELTRRLALTYSVRGNPEEATRALDELDKTSRTAGDKMKTQAIRAACEQFLAARRASQ